MRKMNWLYLFVCVATIVSCKKTPLPNVPEGNQPLYSLNGTMGGEGFEWNLGEDNVTMDIGTAELNGVKTYYGEMHSVLNDEKFRIEFIRPERTRIGDELKVFQKESVDFLVHETGKIQFDFGAAGSEVNILELENADGNWVSTNSLELKEFGYIPIRAKVNHYGNDIFSFVIKHGFADDVLNSAYHVQGSNDSISLDAKTIPGNHEWYIDDVLVGADPTYIGPITDGVHTIFHRLTDEDGNESSTTGLVRYMWGKQAWDMKINYQPDFTFEPINYGRVVVSVYKDGQWYRSDKEVSNMERSFALSDIAIFEGETPDLSVIAYDLDFDAVLYNENMTESLVLSNVNGTFNVGIE